MPVRPRVLVVGLPQVGKSTLCRELSAADPQTEYLDTASEFARQVLERDAAAVSSWQIDGLILAVDATNPLPHFDFFREFLARFRHDRAGAVEVGGLPLTITLTKCDALTPMIEASAARQAAIAKRLADVKTAFDDWVQESDERQQAFGSLEVEFAVSSELPALAASGSINAAIHAKRKRVAQRRLLRVSVAQMLLVALMAAVAAVLLLSQPTAEERLTRRLQAYRQREGPPRVYLAEATLPTNRTELEAIRDHSAFALLADEPQSFVLQRLVEIATYDLYRQRFGPPRLSPDQVRSEGEVELLDNALKSTLIPPPDFEEAWAETAAVSLFRKWKDDAVLLLKHRETWTKWYQEQSHAATSLMLVPECTADWVRNVALLAAKPAPLPLGGGVPGSPSLPQPRGAALSFRGIAAGERVAQAHVDWLEARERLLSLSDLSVALGLTGTPPLLTITDLNTPWSEAAKLQARLEQAYPRRQWSTDRYPDPARGKLRASLGRLHERGVGVVQQRVKELLGRETRERWLAIHEQLKVDPDFRAWGLLLKSLAQWANLPMAEVDPAAALLEYVQQAEFAGRLPKLQLIIPDELRTQPVVVAGPLLITIASRSYEYRLEADPRRDNRQQIATSLASGEAKLIVRPGEALVALLPVRIGEQAGTLEWSRGHSAVFTADRLLAEPILKLDVEEPATGVRLQVPTGGSWPPPPILMPNLPR